MYFRDVMSALGAGPIATSKAYKEAKRRFYTGISMHVGIPITNVA
jgi:hypothetical protein